MAWRWTSWGAEFYCETKSEENYEWYGSTIEAANDAVRDLIYDVDEVCVSDETALEMIILIEDETDDLPSMKSLDWEDTEAVADAFYIAEDVLDFCMHFFEMYEAMIAEII